MAYIPLIKRTEWIDLSNEHKRLRETVEKDLREGCCENGNIQPIMLQGAFGIGKTTTLYYLFHYCWEILKAPAFYMPLAKIVDEVKKVAETLESRKVENHRLSLIIKKMIDEQMGKLKMENYDDAHNLAFPEFQSGDENVELTLSDYLQGFTSVKASFDNGEGNPFENVVFSKEVINTALSSGHVPVLLIDEFESKFYELKKIVASSGGGILRELFDQIVQSHPFQLIIGNGPASGYEVAKEKGDDADSETAANRRLKTIQIPFPASSLLKRKFMEGCENGYVNFIWWMSRCRPGHIQKLHDRVKYDILKDYRSAEFVTQSIFNEPIDEGERGEDVTYLNTSFFESLDSHIFPIIKKLLLDFEPCELIMEQEYIDAFKNEFNAKSFFCSEETVNVEKDLCTALKDDLCLFLDKCKNSDGKYLEINYYTHLNKYFSYILEACSDKNGNMAFNTPYKYAEEALADSFLVPLLELTYDFVSQYEEGETPAIREVRDFLLDCIKHVENSKEIEQISEDFPELSNLFDGFKANKSKGEKVFIQFSLHALREIFEQPIGSPVLRYRGMDLNKKLENISFDNSILLTDSYSDQGILFVPVLDSIQMDAYLNCLEKYIESIQQDLHEKARKTLHIVYLQEDEKIDRFKERVTKCGEEILPITKYRKLVFELLDDYKFNFGRQIQDFIDSVAKIAIVGCVSGEMTSLDGMTIEIHEAISRIKDNSWTPQKEVRRTIEHYEKLVCEGDNAILKTIKIKSQKDYEDALSKAICDVSDYEDNIPCDFTKVVDGKITDERSKCLALLYVMENSGKCDETNKTLTELLKKVGTQNGGSYFSPKEDEILQSLYFDQLKTALLDSNELKDIYREYHPDDKFIRNLYSFVDTMFTEEPAADVKGLLDFMNNFINNHWISSYSDKMKYNCPKAEILMKLLYLFNYVSRMDFLNLRENLKKDLKSKHEELNKMRATLATYFDEVLGLLYSQKPQSDNESQPFYGYLKKLSDVNIIFTLCQRVLDEEPKSMSVLCIVSSVYNRLVTISNSVKVFSYQVNVIKSSLSRLKQNIDTSYQTPINKIYENRLAAQLINMKSPEATKNTFKGYNNLYCWIITRNHLRYNRDEAKNIFNVKLDPIKEDILKSDNVTTFQNYLSRVLQPGTDLKARLDIALKLCLECKTMADDYAEMKSQIEKLLKFE